MTLDWPRFVEDLKEAVDSYDRLGAERMCRELVSRIRKSGERLPAKDTERVMKMLRNCRMFSMMEHVGDASISAREKSFGVRTEYVQALIEKGDLRAASNELGGLLGEYPYPGEAHARGRAGKVRGLLGRLSKQQYVCLTDADSAVKRRVLEEALSAYREAAKLDPNEFWYTINIVALTARAQRDQLDMPELQPADMLARELLTKLEIKERVLLPVWDLATGFEACVACNDVEGALDWLSDYLDRLDASAFEVSSTYRQMVEVWQLTAESGIGEVVLPVLQHAVASRPGGNIELLPAEIRASLAADGALTALTAGAAQSLEKAFGRDTARGLSWFKLMLRRAQMVGQVAATSEPERGIGTGFLVRAVDFFKVPGALFAQDEWLLLTNSHVVSAKERSALKPDVACVNFEVLERTGVEFSKLVWESPSTALDASFLRLQGALPEVALEPYTMAPEPPLHDASSQRRVFVIGHAAAGPLSVSLQDSLQVGWQEPFLHYRTPTERGSSGSPVFDEHWRLVALHHSAREQVRSLDGTSNYDANEGIWIQAIRRRTLALD